MIAKRLNAPEKTEAILWDMDGVLLDTLGLDLTICNRLLQEHFGEHVTLTREYIRSIFAHHIPEFWRLIKERVEMDYNITGAESAFEKIIEDYDRARNNSVFKVNPGIVEILGEAGRAEIKLGVVSSNPTEIVKKILSLSGILDYFDVVVGNDIDGLKKKPAPDTYIHGAGLLKVPPGKCMVIEDSVLGAEAGAKAGCFTVGVATGGIDFSSLEESQWTDRVYSAFLPNSLGLKFGKVTQKRIETPNEFVSHMVEHIAWRLCCEIGLFWNNNDWSLLGETLGKKIGEFTPKTNKGVALGMIDDGSAEVLIELDEAPGFIINSPKNTDLEWFLSLRCEQLATGEPLRKLLSGLSRGLKAKITVTVCSLEDPHHTWEGIFRALGIALNSIYTPASSEDVLGNCEIQKDVSRGDISVIERSPIGARVDRKTAESRVSLAVDFAKSGPGKYAFNVSPSIHVGPLSELLENLSREAGFNLCLDYDATVLSSSHVVMEDTALVLGRALKEILIQRMELSGANGAGSSIKTKEELASQCIRVGVSVEGRKFWKLYPFDETTEGLRKNFLIGQSVLTDLFSEDLDDFLDGLAGGLGCSIMVHIKELPDPNAGWKTLFENLGKALKEVFRVNEYRKGVPPGVKATLA